MKVIPMFLLMLLFLLLFGNVYSQESGIKNNNVSITGEYQSNKINFDKADAYFDPAWYGVMIEFKGVKIISGADNEPIAFKMLITEKTNMRGKVYILEIKKEIDLPNTNIGFLAAQPEDTFSWNLGSPPNKFMITKYSQNIGDIIEGKIDIKLACPSEDCGWLKGSFSIEVGVKN